MKLDAKHWAVVGALLLALAMHLQGLQTWADLLTIKSVGALLFQIGTVVAALLVDSPLNPKDPTAAVLAQRYTSNPEPTQKGQHP